jgi:hypothetical protein
MKLKKLVAAHVAAFSIMAVTPANAISFGIDFKGYVTMVAPTGELFQNTSAATNAFQGYRSDVSGHMILDIGLDGLSGTATFEPFLFSGLTAAGRDINFVPVNELLGAIPLDTLLLGNMLFDYGFTSGVPVSLVLDMGNLTTALMGSSLGDVIGGIMIAPTENTVITFEDGSQGTLPMGPVVVATTTWNTTNADTNNDGVPGPITNGTNPSGVTPLIVDTAVDQTNGDIGLGGSPIRVLTFRGFSPNFDFKEITVTCINLLASCANGGIAIPPLPLNPDPLAPLLGGTSKLLKGLGL